MDCKLIFSLSIVKFRTIFHRRWLGMLGWWNGCTTMMKMLSSYMTMFVLILFWVVQKRMLISGIIDLDIYVRMFSSKFVKPFLMFTTLVKTFVKFIITLNNINCLFLIVLHLLIILLILFMLTYVVLSLFPLYMVINTS